MWPMRSCRKRAGPGEISFTHTPTSAPSGSQTGAPARISVQSNTRFQDGTRLLAIRAETPSIFALTV